MWSMVLEIGVFYGYKIYSGSAKPLYNELNI